MLSSLNKKINLKVNGFPILLKQELNESKLKTHKFKKAGFFDRLMMKPDRNEVVFWSKNCKLTYLKEEIPDAISPILDTKTGISVMYGTSSYLWYKNNILLKFVFQFIQNKSAAQKHIKEFEKKLVGHLGNSFVTNENFTVWESREQKLLLEYPKNKTGYIHLVIID